MRVETCRHLRLPNSCRRHCLSPFPEIARLRQCSVQPAGRHDRAVRREQGRREIAVHARHCHLPDRLEPPRHGAELSSPHEQSVGRSHAREGAPRRHRGPYAGAREPRPVDRWTAEIGKDGHRQTARPSPWDALVQRRHSDLGASGPCARGRNRVGTALGVACAFGALEAPAGRAARDVAPHRTRSDGDRGSAGLAGLASHRRRRLHTSGVGDHIRDGGSFPRRLAPSHA